MAISANDGELNDAVQLYVGVGVSPFPKEDESRIVEHFGAEAAQSLLSGVRTIIAELQEIQPDWDNHTLVSGSQWAVEQVAGKHPELNGESKSALEWLYSWWWK